MRRFAVILITLALISATVSCADPPRSYDLTIASTAGGVVTTPGEEVFLYPAGTVVDLVAEASEGYRFGEWTGDVETVADVGAASTTITVNGNYVITAEFEAVTSVHYELDISSTAGGSVTAAG